MINIAIDGPTASGKSTIAKLVANKLNYAYVDTGAMYRCVTLASMNQAIDLDNEEKVSKIACEIEIYFEGSKVFVNGEDVTLQIRQKEVDENVSLVSSYRIVREKMTAIQKAMVLKKGVVMDGRDIGTIVIPDAELKIFFKADPEIRARRRYEENLRRHIKTEYNEVYEQLLIRDQMDIHKKIGPLIKAEDAILMDTSYMGIDEIVEKIKTLAVERGA